MVKQEFHGVYLPDGDGQPVAMFVDADQAQAWRKSNHPDAGMVAPVDATVKANTDVRDLLALPVAEPEEAPVTDADAELKARIRMELEEEERRARLTEEVRAEMKAEAKANAQQ